jgi:hypothetical protein
MKTTLLAVIACLTIVLTGCTQQQRAKDWGGTTSVDLPPGQKLIVATWKDSHLWYLTRPMHTNETAEEYEFKESSSFGLLQGTVNFKEHKAK